MGLVMHVMVQPENKNVQYNKVYFGIMFVIKKEFKMDKITLENAFSLSNEELIKELDNLVEYFALIEDNTTELLTALVLKKKEGKIEEKHLQQGISSILFLLSKARMYKESLELIAGVGTNNEVNASRQECEKVAKSSCN